MQRIRYRAARIELALNDRSGNRVFLVAVENTEQTKAWSVPYSVSSAD
jgi:hypothetical protein